MTYKFADDVKVSCGPVIVTELTPPKETDIKTETLLQIYRFASAMEATLVNSNGTSPDYLLDECCSIISQLNEIIVARTNTQSLPNLDPRSTSNWGRIDSEGNFGAGK